MDAKPLIGKRELFILGAALVVAGAILAVRTPGAASDPAAAEARKAMSECRTLSLKEYCYATYFRNLTTATDWHHAFDVLHALQKLDVSANGCHLIAHGISRAETEKDPAKWREIMNEAPQECSYGAAHGALEIHAATFPDGKLPLSEVRTVCDNPDTHNCTHILGHLLLVMTDRDIPASLKMCDSLPHDDNGKFECLTGVFMEEITAVNLVEHGLAEKSALNWPARFPELKKLCASETGANSVACWKEITHVAAVSLRGPQEVFDFCATAPGPREKEECVNHAIGILGGSMNFDFNRTRAICDAKVADPGFKENCYRQIIYSTVSTIPAAVPQAERFCRSLAPEYRDSCASAIDNVRRPTGD
jgi:hypothetical protein